jgi:ATP-dependent exoDNAse (exonuclease V) beta subunit
LPREWGEKVHEILSRIRYREDLDTVLNPNVADGTLDQASADWIRDRFDQLASHPLIAPAFSSEAKVKTECEVLYQGAIRRFDRYAELDNAIYLIDYKTGKPNEKYNEQVQLYSKALKEMTDKEIRTFLVYLSEDTIHITTTSGVALR